MTRHAPTGPLVQPLDGTLFGEDQPCFGCGPRHPFGFRLRYEEEGEQVVTRFTPGPQHQGPLGVMHGGLVATVADESAGWAVIAKTGKFGFTTNFEARLRRPVRIGVASECRAWLTKKGPRVVRIATSISQADGECFHGDFTFAILGFEAAQKLMGVRIPKEWRRFCKE
jgi:acyl-coenzyme A thioesterase PaaI-like protein